MPIINMVYKKKWKWKPWANTIAYYPLNANFNDYSDNSYTLTNDGWAITPLSWVSCSYFTLNWKAYNNSVSFGTTRTISLWFSPYQSGTNWVMVWTWWNWSINTTVFAVAVWNNNSLDISNYYNKWVQSNTTISDGSWNYWCVVATWWNVKIYLNWTSVKTSSFALNSGGRIMLWYRWDNGGDGRYQWYLSNVIVEDKARTAQEVSDYYNQTKWNYWIS